MSSTYFLSCACGAHEVRLSQFAHNVLVLDWTGFFERVDAQTHNLGWSVFADGFFDTSKEISGERLLQWVTGIREALRTHADEVPMLCAIIKAASGEDACVYLKIEDAFWMVESVVDELVAKPIEAVIVAERERDPVYGVVVVTGTKAQFPDVDAARPQRFHPTGQQLDAVLEETALARVAKPIGLFFAAEIRALTILAEHAARAQESITSYCI